MHHNVPHLQPQTIHLSSLNASQINNQGNEAIFHLQNKIAIPNNVRGFVSLDYFKFSNVFPNISSTKNVLHFTLSDAPGTTLSVSLPHGNYEVSDLVGDLGALLAPFGVSLTYDENRFRLTLSHATLLLSVKDGDRSMHYSLGFQTNTTPAASYTGQAIRLAGVQALQIFTPSLAISSNGAVNAPAYGLLQVVTNDVTLGSTQSYLPFSSSRYQVGVDTIGTIEIRITDEFGLPLDFDGSAWFIGLHVGFVYQFDYHAPAEFLPPLPAGAIEGEGAEPA